MWLTDPRLMLVGAGITLAASERTRKAVGRGIGYAAAATVKVGGPVAHAAEDIYDEARRVASQDGTTQPQADEAAAAAA
jgi:hypothetical protein